MSIVCFADAADSFSNDLSSVCSDFAAGVPGEKTTLSVKAAAHTTTTVAKKIPAFCGEIFIFPDFVLCGERLRDGVFFLVTPRFYLVRSDYAMIIMFSRCAYAALFILRIARISIWRTVSAETPSMSLISRSVFV